MRGGIIINKVDINTLIKSAQAGDKKSLEQIIKMYKPFIIKKASQIYINGYEVEDLIQIGVMALMKAVNKYKVDRKVAFTTYAVTVIKNAFNEELRKVISKKWDEKFKCSLNNVNRDGLELMELLASDEDVEEEFILKEKITILKKALNQLTEDERELIDWFYFKNKPLKEYGIKKGINMNTLAKRKGRVLEKLKGYFRELNLNY
ncbi:sigma-70 family RNA polymerase sigma factor [Clostridium magnum]|uniref:RNA polymerase sigma-35 factor n=1 Tax=Clostridium magnum DSM 2767 TaxID=1121326 RepID=A0A161Y6U4_9CLOT|nr:sigma-70 family RNA polymerase sigma factor [Clostridium magnum]KZL94069.1 RNA polymerase sigma-35 factor precursor [Clostridium magnum DSM 2767]SHI01509.1 RNA polymerase sigma factor, sigma-70 family [Clostridium magnum DSM 2767]